VTRFKKTARGFTLIELIVVIALIAILTAIAVPSYQTFMVRSRLKGAARQVMSDLMNARMMAVSQNQKVKVHVENGGHTYEIWSDANHDGAVDDNEGVNISKDVQQDYYDVTLSTTSTTNDTIFNPRGAASQFGTVTVTNSAGSKSIAVAISGRVAVSD